MNLTFPLTSAVHCLSCHGPLHPLECLAEVCHNCRRPPAYSLADLEIIGQHPILNTWFPAETLLAEPDCD